MAIYRTTTIKRFLGLSTDVKPDDVPPGSTWFETDTLSWHVFDGATWQAQP